MDHRNTNGWTIVGQATPAFNLNQVWDVEDEEREREVIATWDRDDNWPSV